MNDDLPQLPPHPWKAFEDGWTLREKQAIYSYGEARAKAAREQERAECIALCERVAGDCESWDEGGLDGSIGASGCANAIRARKP